MIGSSGACGILLATMSEESAIPDSVERVLTVSEIDEARATAERLAEERA